MVGRAVALVLCVCSVALLVPAQAPPATLYVEVSTFPTAVDFGTAVVAGNTFYIFGGIQPGYVMASTIYEYDAATDTLTLQGATLPAGRSATASVYDGSRYAYIFGGWDGCWTSACGFNQVLRYDTVSDTVTVMGATLPQKDWGMSAAWVAGKAYLFGGWRCSTCVLRYDPATDTMSTLPATLSQPTYFSTAQGTGTAAYVAAGRYPDFSNPYNTYDEIHRLDAATEAVTLLPATLPTARYSPSSWWDGTQLYVMGGGAATYGVQLAVIETFNPTTGAVATHPRSMPTVSNGDSAAWGPTGFMFSGNTDTAVWCYECPPPAPTMSCTAGSAPGVILFPTPSATGTAFRPFVEWRWDYGDGQTVTVASPGASPATHTYGGPGPYTVTLTVTDSAGKPGVATATCDPVDPVSNGAPVVQPQEVHACLGSRVAVPVHVTDAPGDTVTVNVAGVPPGLAYDAQAGRITGEATVTEPTTFDILVTATDQGGLSGSATIVIHYWACTPASLSPPDQDLDGWADVVDNCPGVWNQDQADGDGDGVGNACTYTAPAGEQRTTVAVPWPTYPQEDAPMEAVPACDLAPVWTVAATRTPSGARVSWSAGPGCDTDFLVWRDGAVLARVPSGVGPYTVEVAAPSYAHRYEVAPAPSGGDLYVAAWAVPSPTVPALPVDQPPDPQVVGPEALPAAAPVEPHSVPWAVAAVAAGVALLALALIVLLLARRKG